MVDFKRPVPARKTKQENIATWHGWTTPEQAIGMIDEMMKWLKDNGHPCPFKKEGE